MSNQETLDSSKSEASEPLIPNLLNSEVIPTKNHSWDAPTIQADAVQGAMVGPWQCKISFLEQFMDDATKEVSGRYVANLVLPTPQLRAIGELFLKLADDLDQAMKENG